MYDEATGGDVGIDRIWVPKKPSMPNWLAGEYVSILTLSGDGGLSWKNTEGVVPDLRQFTTGVELESGTTGLSVVGDGDFFDIESTDSGVVGAGGVNIGVVPGDVGFDESINVSSCSTICLRAKPTFFSA